MHKWIRHGLIIMALVLSICLVWGFWRLEPIAGTVVTAMLVLLAGLALMYSNQAAKWQTVTPDLSSMPPEGFRGTLVLVCGSSIPMEHAQQEKMACWYTSVDTVEDMLRFIGELFLQRPELLGNVAFLFTVLPGQVTDEETLQEQVFAWRRAIARSKHQLGCQPEIWFAIYLDDWLPETEHQKTEISKVWFASRAGQELEVWRGVRSQGKLETWLAGISEPALRMTFKLHLEHALHWWQQNGLAPWQSKQAGTQELFPSAISWHFLPLPTVQTSLWQLYLESKTGLQTVATKTVCTNLPFPHILCDQSKRSNSISHSEKSIAAFVLICACFLVMAMLASFKHNQKLLQNTQADLAYFKSLGDNPLDPKLIARQQLREEAQKLLRWEREGIPVSYGLGLYSGSRILPRLQAALGEWSPPEPPVQEVEQVVILDSLALFETGQSVLKEQANKVLINALVNIKAKPGWLIVVTGHTDSTGTTNFNQQLSERRAEAVRDWMLSVSDLSANCFAVQGLGDTRPVANNNTEEGRGKNRRVEIRLYPQAEACQDANIKSASSFVQDDVVSLQMEK